jgi:hypothetical protein
VNVCQLQDLDPGTTSCATSVAAAAAISNRAAATSAAGITAARELDVWENFHSDFCVPPG